MKKKTAINPKRLTAIPKDLQYKYTKFNQYIIDILIYIFFFEVGYFFAIGGLAL